jgi:hypothetical protein
MFDMSQHEFLDTWKRAKEEEFFHRKEVELLEKMKERASAEAERRLLGEELHVSDDRILDGLRALGYDRATIALLHLVPLIYVAWADGSVSPEERSLILQIARLREIQPGSPAHARLEDWLARKPDREWADSQLRVIRLILESRPAEERKGSERDLVSLCRDVAAASGGFLGIGKKIAAAEREAVEEIARQLERAHGRSSEDLVAHFEKPLGPSPGQATP